MGILASRFVKSSMDFVLAGRNLPAFLATSALFATWFGSETILGASSEFVKKGILGIIEEPLGASLCLFLVGAFFARTFYRMNLVTIIDFFGVKFGRKAEIIAAICIIPSYFGWVAAQLVALGIILHSVTGISMVSGIFIGASIVVLYTFVGGMWAISITDFLQTIIIVIGLSLLLYELVPAAGGFQAIVKKTGPGFFRPFPKTDYISLTNYFVAWITVSLGSIPQQDIFQRVMSSRSEKVAVSSSYLAGALYLSIAFLPLFAALAATQVYPEILQTNPQEILPTVVQKHMPLFIQVIFLGALLSAIMSTASGAILAPASVLGENIIKPLIKELDDKKHLLLLRISVFLIALIGTAFALHRSNIYELVAEASSISLVSLFVPLLGGLLWKRSSAVGAILAMVLGLGTWFFFRVSSFAFPPPVLPGLAASFLGLLAGTYLFRNKEYTDSLNNVEING